MPMPKFTIRMKKDGRVVASFLDQQGRNVRTTRGALANWVKAEEIKQVLEYGKELQLAQCAAGMGSDGTPMPALKGNGSAVFVGRVNRKAVFERRGYPQQKAAKGLKPFRDLYGPGIGGHMLDDVRINYLDDKQGTIAITTRLSRQKALANEQRAEWWGWSPESIQKMTAYAAEVYGWALADYLISMGLMSANVVANAGRRLLRRAA
jgi:hypothetical protein